MRHATLLLCSSFFSVVAATGCTVDDGTVVVDDLPGADSQGEEEGPAVLGPCYRGMSTQLYPIDPTARRCTLGEVPDFVDPIINNGDVGLQFLLTVLNEHDTPLQCHEYEKDGEVEVCVDVVDRFSPGTALEERTTLGVDSRNYFIAYATDYDGSPEVGWWDVHLQHDLLENKPVELTVAGYVRKTGELVHPLAGRPDDPSFRLLKFDPRTCSGCLDYAGPNYDILTTPWEIVVNEWYPGFTSTTCAFELTAWSSTPYPDTLGRDRCLAEQMYRSTGH